MSGQEETLAEKNAKHFDKVITIGEFPEWVRDLHAQITSFLKSDEFLPWLGLPAQGGPLRMLDYACGDGVVSRALQPRFATIIGVDVSDSMLAKFRQTAAALNLPPDAMVGVRGDLLGNDDDDDTPTTDPPLPAAALRDFDLVVTSMALHHFADPPRALRRLAARLRPGGALLVVDWAPLDGGTAAQRAYAEELGGRGETFATLAERAKVHAAAHTISKPNFSEREMAELFGQAGCRDARWRIADELSPIPPVDVKSQLFWAGALKSA